MRSANDRGRLSIQPRQRGVWDGTCHVPRGSREIWTPPVRGGSDARRVFNPRDVHVFSFRFCDTGRSPGAKIHAPQHTTHTETAANLILKLRRHRTQKPRPVYFKVNTVAVKDVPVVQARGWALATYVERARGTRSRVAIECHRARRRRLAARRRAAEASAGRRRP